MGKFSGLITVEFHPPKKYVMKKYKYMYKI